jgi:hypothetical protein
LKKGAQICAPFLFAAPAERFGFSAERDLALWAGWPVVAAPGKQGNCSDGCYHKDDNMDGTREPTAIKMLTTVRILICIGRSYSPGNSPGNQRQSGYSCSNFVSQLHLTSFLIVHLRTGNYSGSGKSLWAVKWFKFRRK